MQDERRLHPRANVADVIACARRPGRLAQMGFATLRADLADPRTHDPGFWAPHLAADETGPVSVVNAAGLLTGTPARMAAVHEAEAAVGHVRYGPSPTEAPSLEFRRSLWFVTDLAAGEVVPDEAVASLRPAGGLPPGERHQVVGRRLRRAVVRGTAATADAVE